MNRKTTTSVAAALLTAAALALLAGCGQKGPLRLAGPDQTASAPAR